MDISFHFMRRSLFLTLKKENVFVFTGLSLCFFQRRGHDIAHLVILKKYLAVWNCIQCFVQQFLNGILTPNIMFSIW